MLGIPEKYKLNKKFDVKTFITSDLTPKEKKRIKETVIDVSLEYQLVGEEIPSLINEEYDCQAILFFGIKLSTIKDASFVGGIIQKLGKPLYVLRFYDHTGVEAYYFARKRLNIQDKSQIVIEDAVITLPASQQFEDEINTLMKVYSAFEKLKNKTNKLCLYLEMMVKSYIISNTSLWSGSKTLLVSKVWYNADDVVSLFLKLKRVEQLKREQKSTKTISNSSKINSELKAIYAELGKHIGGA